MPFSKIYDSDNRDFCLYLTITITDKSPVKRFRVWAEDRGRVNSKYADREIEVCDQNGKGVRKIYFSFPVSPKQLFIGCVNVNEPKDNGYTVDLMEAPLITYNADISAQTNRFLRMATHFSQVCGFEDGSEIGRVFRTNPPEFVIKYFPVIRNRLTGEALNTPARIGHETGIIEVAKCKFDNYTVAMRMMILLHEYCHKYRNPKVGLEISNEKGADINALYIYLSLGWSPVDAICVLGKVFLGAQTQGNIERLRLVNDYVSRFLNEEFASKN